ncbi:aminopeptidase [Coccomyxa subellipsoidea C-169]|uniref:Aminopeptidase n=1 Tax=Coccomyxa subellipsoidea (strain C-169) TaxID=574566 RepID=I0YV03_COCSC|nr:aminopeptidase [Coccomyxa subellipsoidea C-169]EIE22222.1 aminopeptidase [Coccomyxa subellipsoidea C-169]|eukprot:XP_005646766.1 aminopeptidase [Coccomyxa subellipsoidea C-169]
MQVLNVNRLPSSFARISNRSSHVRQATRSVPLAPTIKAEDVQLGQALLDAHAKAVELFKVIESKDLLKPGRTEEDINKEIFDLAAVSFGTRKYWHVRLVRTGENTIHPIHVKTPDRILKEDDIAFIDLGPVFENVEADFARNYVIGNDPEKNKLSAALPKIFKKCKAEYQSRPDMTGAELYAFVLRTCQEHGYKYANTYCAHLLGRFSHKMDYGLEDVNFARPENHTPMSAAAPNGDTRFWVLEIHILQDPAIGMYGGFYEDLLNL